MVYVVDLQVDEDNEVEMARHNVTPDEVWQLLTNKPRIIRNKGKRRATHVMIGLTDAGRLLTVPIISTSVDGQWRPVTAYDASRGDRTRFFRERSEHYDTGR